MAPVIDSCGTAGGRLPGNPSSIAPILSAASPISIWYQACPEIRSKRGELTVERCMPCILLNPSGLHGPGHVQLWRASKHRPLTKLCPRSRPRQRRGELHRHHQCQCVGCRLQAAPPRHRHHLDSRGGRRGILGPQGVAWRCYPTRTQTANESLPSFIGNSCLLVLPSAPLMGTTSCWQPPPQ